MHIGRECKRMILLSGCRTEAIPGMLSGRVPQREDFAKAIINPTTESMEEGILANDCHIIPT